VSAPLALRVCSVCGVEQPSDQFRPSHGVCNACQAAKQRARRLADPEADRAISRRHEEKHKEKRLEKTRLWRQQHPEQARASNRAWHSAHPESARESGRRWKAANQDRFRLISRNHDLVHKAIRRGDLIRASHCEECGLSGIPIEAAHADYSRPLDVRWLCRPCHRRWDSIAPKSKEVSA
jgi:hypothetical protein